MIRQCIFLYCLIIVFYVFLQIYKILELQILKGVDKCIDDIETGSDCQ